MLTKKTKHIQVTPNINLKMVAEYHDIEDEYLDTTVTMQDHRGYEIFLGVIAGRDRQAFADKMIRLINDYRI